MNTFVIWQLYGMKVKQKNILGIFCEECKKIFYFMMEYAIIN